jgi:adenylate cyclase
MVDIDRLVGAGLYEPDAADAGDRLELLDFLSAAGATLAEMVEADRTGSLASLAADLRMRRGDLSAVELSERAGVSLDAVTEVYRLLGLAIVDPTDRIFDDREVQLLELLEARDGPVPDRITDEILRSIGAGLAIIAESSVSAFVGSVEGSLDRPGGELHRASVTAASASAALELGSLLGPLLRHHLWAAVRRQRAAMTGSEDRLDTRSAVGFVDLVGFTSLTASFEASELLEFVRDFHQRTVDVVTRRGGRVVKHIGDEIMFSAVDPGEGCEIALSLVEAFADDRSQPRGGLAYGRLVARHGDYYGPIVNLAARLADIAVPGEVLADAALAATVDDGRVAFDPAGQRMLKGFAEPVAVVSVARRA